MSFESRVDTAGCFFFSSSVLPSNSFVFLSFPIIQASSNHNNGNHLIDNLKNPKPLKEPGHLHTQQPLINNGLSISIKKSNLHHCTHPQRYQHIQHRSQVLQPKQPHNPNRKRERPKHQHEHVYPVLVERIQ